MKILNIKLFNYGSFVGEHFISLVDRGLVLIQGINKDETKMDSNGAGKSHIPDSLDWCINGKVPREDNADSVINDNCKDCFVEVQIESDTGDMIFIKRSKKRGESTILKLFLNDDDLTKLDSKETQKEIYYLLGIDRDIFHSTVLFAQNDLVHYADSSDSKRMEVLTKLLQLEFVDDLLTVAKRKQNELSHSEQNILGKKQSIEGELYYIKDKDWETLIKDWEDNRNKDINNLHIGISELVFKLDSIIVMDMQIYKSKIDELNWSLTQIGYPKDTEYQNILKETSSIDIEIGILKNELIKVDSKIVEVQRQLSIGKNYYCDKCGQLVSIDHLRYEVDKALMHKEEININLNLLQDKVREGRSRANFEKEKLEKAQHDAQNKTLLINVELQKCRDSISKIENDIRDKKSLEEGIAHLQKTLQEEKNKVNPWLIAKEESYNNILRLENDLFLLKQQLDSVYALKECYSFWISAFGSKGLKSYILDTKLQELNDAINYWINLLTDGTLWVQLGSYKKGRSVNKVINSPDVRVCRWASDGSVISRNYKSWSGGEKQRVSLAIDFGLSSIISSRSSKKYNLIILDEVFKHLDRGGKESIMEMLKLLDTEKESLFVIEHDSDFQSLFENIITVIKENSASRFMEEDYEHKKCDEKTTPLLLGRRVVKRTAIRNSF